MKTSLYDTLRPMIGQDQSDEVTTDEVCRQMIRHWCEAVQSANPLYVDEEYCARSKYHTVVAPPAMMSAWCMPPLWPIREQPQVMKRVLEACTEHGFDDVVAAEYEMEFYRPVIPGDRLHATIKLHGVTPEKHTWLGDGHFITFERTYIDQKGDTVGVDYLTIFKYRVGGKSSGGA